MIQSPFPAVAECIWYPRLLFSKKA